MHLNGAIQWTHDSWSAEGLEPSHRGRKPSLVNNVYLLSDIQGCYYSSIALLSSTTPIDWSQPAIMHSFPVLCVSWTCQMDSHVK